VWFKNYLACRKRGMGLIHMKSLKQIIFATFLQLISKICNVPPLITEKYLCVVKKENFMSLTVSSNMLLNILSKGVY
jgi:hypothetical protein